MVLILYETSFEQVSLYRKSFKNEKIYKNLQKFAFKNT